MLFAHFFRQKSRHSVYFALAWFHYSFWGIFNGLLFLFNWPLYALLGSYITIPMAIFTVLFLDSISREDISLQRMIIIVILSTIKVVLLMQPGAVQAYPYPGGGEKLGLNPVLMGVSSIMMFLLGLWYVYFMGRIAWNAPHKMKREAIPAFVGAILMGLVGPVVALFGINISIIASVGIGAMLTTAAFVRQPGLAFILPYKVYRLTVVDNRSGIHLFTKVWNPEEEVINPELFSGMLQGISGILQESLRKGLPREILLEKAIMLLQRSESYPVTFVLIASKSSAYLRHALQLFVDLFCQKFKVPLEERKRINTFDYDPANQIVQSCFPYIPEFEKKEKNKLKTSQEVAVVTP